MHRAFGPALRCESLPVSSERVIERIEDGAFGATPQIVGHDGRAGSQRGRFA